MNESNEFRVFLAHSKEDKPLVREIYFLLQLDGFLPWLDQENLKPGQNWRLEIDKAVAASHAVVVFISPSGVDRAGYLHKEIGLALDVAEQQPEASICTIPVKLGECEMPRRLSHLHWVWAPTDPNPVAGIYSQLQTSLLTRACELGILSREELHDMPAKPNLGVKGKGRRPLQCGRYVVRGHNPDGQKYYGIAKIEKKDQQYEMTAKIGGRVMKYVGDCSHDEDAHFSIPEPVVLRGEYEVTYAIQSWTGIYQGSWGEGGTEELIPASPMAGDRTA
jgi:TIR domain